MAKIAFIDHSFHQKTNSTEFLTNILKKHGHTVDFFWDETWRGCPTVPYYRVANYDIIIMFQARCSSNEYYFRRLHPNVIYIPMLDTFEIYRGPLCLWGTHFESFQGCKILSFSSALHAMATSFGISSFHVQYYQSPITNVIPKDSPRGFLWIRNENHVSWSLIKKLIGNTNFSSIHLHFAPDPFTTKPILPDETEIKKYNITTSNWFDNKQDFLKVLNRANIFFAPRRDEGIGQSFLEAMARGMCVVAPDNGTMNEYILHGVNGLLYNPEHPSPLDFSQFEKLGEAARQSVSAGYERWLEAEERLLDYILMPSEKGYKGLFQHSIFQSSKVRHFSLKEIIRNLKIIKTTENIWLPVWNILKKRKRNIHSRKKQNNISLCNIPIFTSIIPKRIKIQKKAISTWLDQGFTPVSVNYFYEIEKLKNIFPRVIFIQAQTNSDEYFMKKRIFINELLYHANVYSNKNHCRYAGIVNSDVSLYKINIDLLSIHAESSIIFSHRNDVIYFNDPGGVVYNNGIDAFFFKPEYFSDFPHTILSLGEPWWDFVLPLWAILKNINILKCSIPLCFHVIHNIKWNKEMWLLMGNIVYDLLRHLSEKSNTIKNSYLDLSDLFDLITNKSPTVSILRELSEKIVNIFNSIPCIDNIVEK